MEIFHFWMQMRFVDWYILVSSFRVAVHPEPLSDVQVIDAESVIAVVVVVLVGLADTVWDMVQAAVVDQGCGYAVAVEENY